MTLVSEIRADIRGDNSTEARAVRAMIDLPQTHLTDFTRR